VQGKEDTFTFADSVQTDANLWLNVEGVDMRIMCTFISQETTNRRNRRAESHFITISLAAFPNADAAVYSQAVAVFTNKINGGAFVSELANGTPVKAIEFVKVAGDTPYPTKSTTLTTTLTTTATTTVTTGRFGKVECVAENGSGQWLVGIVAGTNCDSQLSTLNDILNECPSEHGTLVCDTVSNGANNYQVLADVGGLSKCRKTTTAFTKLVEEWTGPMSKLSPTFTCASFKHMQMAANSESECEKVANAINEVFDAYVEGSFINCEVTTFTTTATTSATTTATTTTVTSITSTTITTTTTVTTTTTTVSTTTTSITTTTTTTITTITGTTVTTSTTRTTVTVTTTTTTTVTETTATTTTTSESTTTTTTSVTSVTTTTTTYTTKLGDTTSTKTSTTTFTKSSIFKPVVVTLLTPLPAGSSVIDGDFSAYDLKAGQEICFAVGTPFEECNMIAGLASIILAFPMKNSHPAGVTFQTMPPKTDPVVVTFAPTITPTTTTSSNCVGKLLGTVVFDVVGAFLLTDDQLVQMGEAAKATASQLLLGANIATSILCQRTVFAGERGLTDGIAIELVANTFSSDGANAQASVLLQQRIEQDAFAIPVEGSPFPLIAGGYVKDGEPFITTLTTTTVNATTDDDVEVTALLLAEAERAADKKRNKNTLIIACAGVGALMCLIFMIIVMAEKKQTESTHLDIHSHGNPMSKHSSILVNGGGAYGMPEDKRGSGGMGFGDDFGGVAQHLMGMGGAGGFGGAFGGMDSSYFDVRPGAKTPAPGFGKDRFNGNGTNYHPSGGGGGIYGQSQQLGGNYQHPASPTQAGGGQFSHYLPAQSIGPGFLSNNAFADMEGQLQAPMSFGGQGGGMFGGGGGFGFMQGGSPPAPANNQRTVGWQDQQEGYIGVGGMESPQVMQGMGMGMGLGLGMGGGGGWSQHPDEPQGDEWTVLQPQPGQPVRSPAEIPSRASFGDARPPSGPAMGDWSDAQDALQNFAGMGGRSGAQTAKSGMSMDNVSGMNQSMMGAMMPQHDAWSQQPGLPEDEEWTVLGGGGPNNRMPTHTDFM
jgi:hypothetical protein